MSLGLKPKEVSNFCFGMFSIVFMLLLSSVVVLATWKLLDLMRGLL